MPILLAKNRRISAASSLCAILISLAAALPYAKRISQRLVGDAEGPLREGHIKRSIGANKSKFIEPAPPSGVQFDLSRNVIAGGGGTSTGGTFSESSTIGEVSASSSQSGGQFTLNGGFWNTVFAAATPTATPTPTPTASPTPTPIPNPTPTPTPTPGASIQLLLDSSGPDPEQAAALDAALLLRDPFQVINDGNFFTQPNDRNTRVMLFATNLSLGTNEPPSAIRVHLIDANGSSYDVLAEDARQVPNFPFMQVVFRLPDSLAPGRCLMRIELHNEISNTGAIRIRL